MSSAILYLAIIAIWAGVLIPRWLRRDTSQPIAEEATGEMDAEAGLEPDDARGYEDGEREAAAGFGRVDSANRGRILVARRRMLMMLAVLAVAAFGIVLVNLAAWWVTIPPIGMLAGYLMLLREARHADAERLAEMMARAEDRRRGGREREMAAQGAEAGRSDRPTRIMRDERAETARVIDISERVKDELYDQYADTERRAVGD